MARSPPDDDRAGLAGAVRDSARQGEADRYFAALLAPAPLQGDLVALAAFAAELGRIPATVSDAMIGEIRLQWWRDAIEAQACGERLGHPVADALGLAMRRHRLPAAELIRMIDARSFDLTGEIHGDDAHADAYFDATDGVPIHLAATILAGPVLADAGLAQRAGRIYGMARALGRLPVRFHNGGFPISAERLRAAGVDVAALGTHPVADAAQAGVGRAAEALRGEIQASLHEIRPEIARLTRPGRTAFLPLAMVEPYFAIQRRGGARLLDARPETGALERIVRLWLAHQRGRV